MRKQGLDKRTWRLAGLILGFSILLLSLYSISALGRRLQPLPPGQMSILPAGPNGTPTAGVGAALSVEMTARGYWTPASMDGIDPQFAGGDLRLTQVAQQAGQSGVERELCITNTGTRETRGLAIQDSIEVEKSAGVFESLPGMQLEFPVQRELVPHERWCQVERIGFSPAPGARHRLTTTVTITNHAQLLPGSPACPAPEGCPYRLAVSAFLNIPSTSMLLSTPTPSLESQLPQATVTPVSRSVVVANPGLPPGSPPQEAPPPPGAPAPTNRPQDTDTPEPEKPTQPPPPTQQEPRPSRTPQPTRPPDPPAPTATDKPDPTRPPDPPPDEDPGKKPKPTKPPDPGEKPPKPPKPTKEPK